EDIAGDEAGPEAGQAPASQATPTGAIKPASNTASKGLGIAALILGALGLLAGLTALAATRRTRSA
ncbi:MAG TPA: hypothetical protein VIG42_04235, partial [Solirubrobacteraceae bacterium]